MESVSNNRQYVSKNVQKDTSVSKTDTVQNSTSGCLNNDVNKKCDSPESVDKVNVNMANNEIDNSNNDEMTLSDIFGDDSEYTTNTHFSHQQDPTSNLRKGSEPRVSTTSIKEPVSMPGCSKLPTTQEGGKSKQYDRKRSKRYGKTPNYLKDYILDIGSESEM